MNHDPIAIIQLAYRDPAWRPATDGDGCEGHRARRKIPAHFLTTRQVVRLCRGLLVRRFLPFLQLSVNADRVVFASHPRRLTLTRDAATQLQRDGPTKSDSGSSTVPTVRQ
jgi:hypothetical protein